MTISPAGAIVCLGLLLLGFCLRAPLIVALFGSLAFGATALTNLSSLGGSSPLIYTFFVLLLCASILARRTAWAELGTVFAASHTSWLICALLVYVLCGAFVFPRLFAGEVNAFVPMRLPTGVAAIVETPLGPTGGNVTQTAYFLLSASMFFMIGVVLLRCENFAKVRSGFIAWAFVQAALGSLDFGSKLAGIRDVLAPIRTASYAMLTSVELAGFYRIAGGFSEASAFGSVTVVCLAYTFSDWKVSRSPWMLALTGILFTLVILSTSSTAYLALALVLGLLGLSVSRSILSSRISGDDIFIVAAAMLAAVGIMAAFAYDSRITEPFLELLDETLFDKAKSASAIERSYWNTASLQAALDTDLLGIGLGSSRASSWAVAVISQLGLLGAIGMACLIAVLCMPMSTGQQSPNYSMLAVSRGARSAALASIVTGSISGGGADPGIVFFAALAVVVSFRSRMRETSRFDFSRADAQIDQLAGGRDRSLGGPR